MNKVSSVRCCPFFSYYKKGLFSILDLEVKSVKKKFKDKSFAVGVDRQTVRNECEMLGMELDEVIRKTIEGMKEKAGKIGLKGNL